MTSKKLFDLFYPDGHIIRFACLPQLERLNFDTCPWYKGFYNGVFASSSDMTGEMYRCTNNKWVMVKQNGK